MTTARELIEAALRKITAIGKGASLPSDEAQDALEALNVMLGSASVDALLIPTVTYETFNLTVNTASYSMYSGGDFNTARPVDIENIYVTINEIDYPLTAIGSKEYSEITDKTEDGLPQYYYYDNAYPSPAIKLFPVPNEAGTITICSQKYISEFASLNTVYNMAPEYKKFIIYNLAVELAPEYEKDPSFTVMKEARRSRNLVKAQNHKNDQGISVIDGVLLGGTWFKDRDGTRPTAFSGEFSMGWS